MNNSSAADAARLGLDPWAHEDDVAEARAQERRDAVEEVGYDSDED